MGAAAQTHLRYPHTKTQNGRLSKISRHRCLADHRDGLMPIRHTGHDNDGNQAISGQMGEDPWWREQEESTTSPVLHGHRGLHNGLLPLPLPLSSVSGDSTGSAQSLDTGHSPDATSSSPGTPSPAVNGNAPDSNAEGNLRAPQAEAHYVRANGLDPAEVEL